MKVESDHERQARQLLRLDTLEAENQRLREALRSLHNEVDCRIEHGAETGGHLEYVRVMLAGALALAGDTE